MFGDSNGFFIPLIADSNLFTIVVITASLLLSSSSDKCFQVFALSTIILHFLKVSDICLSRSVRSVTIIIFEFLILLRLVIACASITIVRDFQLPCVCQMTHHALVPH
jgi:hypothetical protein